MDSETLSLLCAIAETAAKDDWKQALDSLFATLRGGFVFDNLAIYLADARNQPEVIYARAVGRGRKAEADAAWGEGIAGQVLSSGKMSHSTPPSAPPFEDRVSRPYLLGLPLCFSGGAGALVFIRFGGPEFTPEQVRLAEFVAAQIARIFERRAMRDKIKRLEADQRRAQLQEDFIATVSHDLHTPLGFIKGYTTSLLRQDAKWDLETQREFLTIIDEETDHLIQLIEKLLDSARLKSGMMRMDFQPVRLDSLIRDVVLRTRARHESLEVELDLKKSPPIQADVTRLAQVFINLFENALKYAPGSKIHISLFKVDDHLRVIFSDEGPGIPPEHLPFIFERFYRVPAVSGKHGTGLGLYICRQIIQAHHGQISVETSPGKGTTFSINLLVHR